MAFAVDLYEEPEAYVLKAALPGIALPLSIEPSKVVATFKDGILQVTLPKAEIVKPKQIKVTPV